MLSMTLQEAALAVDGRLVGADLSFSRVSTDTRTLHGGALFVALRGERFDAHDFVAKAQQAGAVAALVEREMTLDLPQLVVSDSRLALGQLAAAWRQKSAATLIAITGSNGKTTVKEMLRAIFSQEGAPVLATEGNLNNDIGLPLTLLRLQDEPLAVVEMGANHAGEIDYLSRLAQPDCVLLNNAGRAHLEGFGSLEGVARAKVEIVNGLKQGGWFVYNAASPWADLWRELTAGRQRIGFGDQGEVGCIDGSAVTDWTEEGFYNRFGIRYPGGEFTVGMKLAGKHNQMNALAAATVALALGRSPQQIAQGLASLEPVKGRLRCERVAGVYVVDDSYNANPDSVEAAIDVLKGAAGRRVLVLGDLGELGPDAADLHRSLGERARQAGIDALFAMGNLSAHAVEGFAAGGVLFSSREALVERLKETVEPGDAVLVKGSRSAGMERVIALFKGED